MRSAAHGDVLKVWLYAIATALLGAWLAPFLYNMGKALAEVSAVKQTNGPLEWLADLARAADFPQFFVASLGLAAAFLALPFAGWLRADSSGSSASKPWQSRIPITSGCESSGQPLAKNPHALRQLSSGFGVGAGLFSAIGSLLLISRFSHLGAPAGNQLLAVTGILSGAIASGVLQEIMFRGMVFGIFLRSMSPPFAIGVSALLFASIHFLFLPHGLNVADPDIPRVGFEMLGSIISQLSSIEILVESFAPMLVLGAVLAFARWRTASLWLPIGLHVGWIFVTAMFDHFTLRSVPLDAVMELLIGKSLQQGGCAIIGILIAGGLINLLTVRLSHPPDPANDA